MLASKSIADAIGEDATMLDMHPVIVKGRDQPIGVAEVVAVKSRSRQRKGSSGHPKETRGQ